MPHFQDVGHDIISQKKPKAPSFFVNCIMVKFGWNVLNLNMHWLMESFLIWGHNFKTAAILSFHAEKCRHLASNHEASVVHVPVQQHSSVPADLLYIHTYLFLYFRAQMQKYMYTLRHSVYVRLRCLAHSCISIKFLCEHMSMKWVLEHQLLFIKAVLFVIMDLTGEVRHAGIIILLFNENNS